MLSSLIQIGKITGVHGVKGLVEIKPFLTNPADVARLKPVTDKGGTHVFDVTISGQKGDVLLCQIRGINDRTAAEKLKGTELYVPKNQLPKADENEFYYCDLVGLRVMKDGQVFGSVSAVNNYGAGDILSIAKTDGSSVDLVFQDKTFPRVDVAGGFMDVVLPHGLKGDTDEG